MDPRLGVHNETRHLYLDMDWFLIKCFASMAFFTVLHEDATSRMCGTQDTTSGDRHERDFNLINLRVAFVSWHSDIVNSTFYAMFYCF